MRFSIAAHAFGLGELCYLRYFKILKMLGACLGAGIDVIHEGVKAIHDQNASLGFAQKA